MKPIAARAAALAVTLALAAAAVLAVAGTGAAQSNTPPPIKHVFIVMLENETESTSFGASSPATYLSKTLPTMGEFVPNYYGIGHASLDNYVALISGQGPNPVTQSDCQTYTDFMPGTTGADGQAMGSGCVYPASVSTIANQLADKGLTWKGYMEDMGNSTTESKTCRHPALNSSDDTQTARAGDQYAARHNPFVYFHSIIDSPMCNANDVPYDRFASDLQTTATTANYSFITPNLCDDGHDAPCKDGRPGGLVTADKFLQAIVPEIMSSPAYQQDGLLIVTFDESASGAESCCGETASNTPNAGGTSSGPGGGKVGAVLLSPFIAPGTVNQNPYNHYSLLRSIEDIFGLSHLGYAGASGLNAFGADVYNAPPSSTPTTTTATPATPTPVTPIACRAAPLSRRAHGNLRRGTLIASAGISHNRLSIRVRTSVRISIIVRLHGRNRTVARRSIGACRTYSFTLPRRRTRTTVTATVRRAHERRTLH